MVCDIELARKAKKQAIVKIAKRLGIDKKYLIPYGRYIAKIDLSILNKIEKRRKGKYILVTAITPTPLGEGKTVNAIGLAMALNRLGKPACVSIRQPCLGPVFGIKGGAAGGGYSQVLPMEDFNLHFTGDAHAVESAHNLAAAFLDNALFRGNKFKIDPDKIYWRRVTDISDRALRNIRIGLESTVARDSGFEITAASEIMAILSLSSSLQELRQRLEKIVLAETGEGKLLTTKDLKASGSMAALLKDALLPNLIQTIENTPCFVHTGPFGNIAHGNNSILADKIALAFSEYVVTESGFGADCGAEKFFDIKCRISGLVADAAVLVCSIRALKAHSGRFRIIAGKPLDPGLKQENIPAIEAGLQNLAKQIENIRVFGIPVVVAINRFDSDTQRELDFVKDKAIAFGADDCQVSEVWAKGSCGGTALAKAAIRAASLTNRFKFLYPPELPVKEKIRIIATQIYGAREVEYTQLAEEKIKLFSARGFANLPVCMAKTHLSLSADPLIKGRPRDFILPVRDIRIAAGAGFITALCGQIQTLPGLPTYPAGENIDIDQKGNIIGLS